MVLGYAEAEKVLPSTSFPKKEAEPEKLLRLVEKDLPAQFEIKPVNRTVATSAPASTLVKGHCLCSFRGAMRA